MTKKLLPSKKKLDNAYKGVYTALNGLPIVVCVGLLEQIKTDIIPNTGVVKIK